MAALLGFGARRIFSTSFRLSSRHSSLSWMRNGLKPSGVNKLNRFLPNTLGLRQLSDSVSTSDADFENQNEAVDKPAELISRRPQRRRQEEVKSFSRFSYERTMRKLGSMSSKETLRKHFEHMLREENQITQVQAYQLLRNCGTELLYEPSEGRIDLVHHIWDKLQLAGVQPDEMLYNALLSVYIQNQYDFKPLEVLDQMQKNNVEPNRTTMVLLVQAFGQGGDIAGAFKVLEFMKVSEMPITEAVYAALITAYGKTGDMESAKGVFDLMRQNGLEPGLESYISLLCLHAEKGDMDIINKLIEEMQEYKLYPNHSVYTALLDTLSKCGHHELIPQILDKHTILKIVQADLRSLMMTFAARGEITSAFSLLNFIPRLSTGSADTNPDSLLLKQVIMSGQPKELVVRTVNDLNQRGIMKNVYETALDLSYNKRSPETSLAIIQEMFDKEVPVRVHYFYPLLAVYSDKMDAEGSQGVFNIMTKRGFQIDPISLGYLVQSFGQTKYADVDTFLTSAKDIPLSPYLVQTLAQLMMETGNVEKLSSLLDYCEKEEVKPSFITKAYEQGMKRSFDDQKALKILQLLDQKGFAVNLSHAHSAVINHVGKTKGGAKQAVNFITHILREGLNEKLDSRSYTHTLSWLYEHSLEDEFFEFVRVLKDNNVPLDEHQYRQMTKMLATVGNVSAAQHCFDKFKALKTPDASMYSHLICSFGNTNEGGLYSSSHDIKNLKKMVQLYGHMTEIGLVPFARALSYVIISHLYLGDIAAADKIRSEHGHGSQQYRVYSEYLRAYSKRGDVPKVLELFEEMKAMPQVNLSTFAFNQLLGVYKFHGDAKAQREILNQMKQDGYKADHLSYSEFAKTYLFKEDVESALKVFEESKENGTLITTSTSLLLLNVMARTGNKEFERVLNEIVTVKVESAQMTGRRNQFFLNGLVFTCLHAGRRDLADNIIEKYGPQFNNLQFMKLAQNSAMRGEVAAIQNCMDFMTERGLNYGLLYIPLLNAYDSKKDPDSALAVYQKVEADGQPANNSFKIALAQILQKYNYPVPFEVPSANQRETRKQEEVLYEEESDVFDYITPPKHKAEQVSTGQK